MIPKKYENMKQNAQIVILKNDEPKNIIRYYMYLRLVVFSVNIIKMCKRRLALQDIIKYFHT